MLKSDFRYLERLRVRWAEVDMQKIVFNGHYLMYADTAVAGYWRALALPYHETMESLEGDLYVRKATLEYLGSARYDDLIEVGIRCGRIGNSSMSIAVGIFRGERCLVHGELLYVFADPVSQTSRTLPAPLRAVVEGFEAGEAIFELRVGAWSALHAACTELRHAVFVAERGLPPALAADLGDEAATHIVAVNRLGVALATGRLTDLGDRRMKIERMATRQDMRGAGFGRAVLRGLLDAARARGAQEVGLDADVATLPFYAREGFEPTGAGFEESGVRHQPMRCRLVA